MNCKFAILLLLAAAAQSSLAEDTSESCVESASTIKSDLEIIAYGQETSVNGLRQLSDAIYDEIISILADRRRSSRNFRGNNIRSRNSDVRFNLAKNKAHEGLQVGIEPTVKAIKVFQPETDIAISVNRSSFIVQTSIRNIFSAINLTRVATNDNASKAQLAEYTTALLGAGQNLIEGLYGSLLTGNTPIPDAAVPMIKCVGTKAKSHISGAIQGIADEIAVLYDAVLGIGTEDAYERITAIWKKSRSSFDTEVLYKYSIIRNLVVGAYLQNSNDIVTGLFDIQSTLPGYTDI